MDAPQGRDPGRVSAGDIREIQTLSRLDRALRERAPLAGLRIQDLDLTGRETALLARTDLDGLVVLGGRLSPALEDHLRDHGAIVFPTDPRAPVDPYRSALYHPEELYAGLTEHGYAGTPDARAWRWSLDAASRHDVYVTLLRAIHDDSVSDALDEFLGDSPVVGVLGGHAVRRDDARYAAAARLGGRLAAAGFTVATGGGPGAMEAANLGAFAADAAAVADATETLAAVPSTSPSVRAWAGSALAVRASLPHPRTPHRASRARRGLSVGVPTWHYGHEPPNVFCHGIAKYFSNALREDSLLARSGAGLVVLEGAAGTVQEVFQAATRLYYARADDPLPTLVLVGRTHWTSTVPVWPALRALADGRSMARAVHLVDTVDEAGALLAG